MLIFSSTYIQKMFFFSFYRLSARIPCCRVFIVPRIIIWGLFQPPQRSKNFFRCDAWRHWFRLCALLRWVSWIETYCTNVSRTAFLRVSCVIEVDTKWCHCSDGKSAGGWKKQKLKKIEFCKMSTYWQNDKKLYAYFL